MNKWKVETHCHSLYSKDSLTNLDKLIHMARKRGLDKLILTDHNNIQGALRAKEMAPDLIIVGEEILTTAGEFLAFFVKEEIPRGLEPMEVIKRLKEQDAFISISHPFDLLRHGWPLPLLDQIRPHLDAIEVFNGRSFTKNINQKAGAYARQYDMAGTVGSDAHTLGEIGSSYMILPPFTDAKSLRLVINDAEYVQHHSSPLVRFGSTFAKIYKQVLGKR